LVDQIDDHANHMDVHRGFMKSDRYEHLSQEAHQLFVDHLTAHEMYAAQQAAQQTLALQAGGPAAALVPTAASQVLPPDALAGAQPAPTPQSQAPSGPQEGTSK
jgi:hypothetical protein